MAKIPGEIQYTEGVPRAEVGAVRAPTQVITGAEAIARGVEALGEGFQKVAEAKRAVDFSTKKRQYDETTFAAYQTYQQTGDAEERKKLQDKWSKDVDVILSSDDGFLRTSLNEFRNQAVTRDGQTFASAELAINQRNNLANGEVGIQEYMKSGQIGEAAKESWKLVLLNLRTPAEHKQFLADAPSEMILVQARQKLADTNPDTVGKSLKDAVESLNNLNPKDLTERQLDYREKLRGMANEMLGKHGDNTVKSVILGCYQNKDKSPVERDTLADQYVNQIINSGRTDAETGALVDRVERFRKGEKEVAEKITPKLQAIYSDMARHEDSIPAERKMMSSSYIDQIDSLDLTDTQKRQALADVREFVQRGKVEKEVKTVTDRAVWNKLYTQNMRARTPNQIEMAKKAVIDSSASLDDADFKGLIELSEKNIASEQKEGLLIASEDFKSRFKGDEKTDDTAATQGDFDAAMLEWMGKQKDPPSLMEIKKHGAELAAGWIDKTAEEIAVQYEVGQVINKGGKTWKVTGFDKVDGNPLVDEVK